MNRATSTPSTTSRIADMLLRALAPHDDLKCESDLLEHFPFARVGERDTPKARLRMPTTVHGSL